MELTGRVLSCVGGLYTVQNDEGSFHCYAKGSFRAAAVSPVAGDLVAFEKGEGSEVDASLSVSKKEYGLILRILDRKNLLIRPPLANLDQLFIVAAAANPEPNILGIDKLCAIAVHHEIRPILVFNKCELDPEGAFRLAEIYRGAGFDAFALHHGDPEQTRRALLPYLESGISAFTGASGVGKSTLINTLFPDLVLQTGSVGEKSHRGRHTTRQSTLFAVPGMKDAYIADTPGFSQLDFERFFFMEKEDLAFNFPEFTPYLTKCRYTKCTHLTEDGCAIIGAVAGGGIAKSRHESYKTLFGELKDQHAWQKKPTRR